MKRTILSGTLALMAGIACAQLANPAIYENETLMFVSPNGLWAAGTDSSGKLILKNLETNQTQTFGTAYICPTAGNPVSNNGILVAADTKSELVYWKNGKWNYLKLQSGILDLYIAGISADGSTICGNLAEFNETSYVPVVWTEMADGSYSKPVYLPYPQFDHNGESPQRVTAISISNDGKVIAGQYLDSEGTITRPIIYIRESDGSWSYRMPGEEMYSLLEEIPSKPEIPDYPNPLNYMSEEKAAAYKEMTSQGRYPDPEEYMTPEQAQAYHDALTQYSEDINNYFDRLTEWDTEYQKYLSQICILGNNYAMISGNGRYYASVRQISSDGGGIELGYSLYPVVFDLSDDSYTLYPSDLTMVVSAVANDGTILTYSTSESVSGTEQAYAILPGSIQPEPLEDYIKPINLLLASWMNDNMVNSVAVSTQGTSYVYGDFMCSGAPVATPDLSTIVSSISTTNLWQNPKASCLTYLLPVKEASTSGVEEALVENGGEFKIVNGSIELKNDIGSLAIYDLSGSLVYRENHPGATVTPSLTKGIYILKVEVANGSHVVQKIAL